MSTQFAPKDEREAANYLRLSPRTLQKWRRLNTGPTYSRQGSSVVYLTPDLDQWLLANRVTREEGHAV